MTFDPQAVVATPREVAARDREVIARADIVPVKFLDDCRGHYAGEMAGFPRAEAQMLVDQGFASFDHGAALKIAAPPAAIEKANGALTAAAMGEVGITFVQSWESWTEGESASFSESLARKLISVGVAVPHVPTPVQRRTLADIRAGLKGR